MDNKLVMSRPANGRNYDSFIFSQYFNVVIDGENAPNQATLDAISAILSLPSKNNIKLTDKALVEAARKAYNQVTSTTQQGIIIDGGYYEILTGAEKQISDLEYLQNQGKDEEEDTDTNVPAPPQDEPQNEPKKDGKVVAIVILSIVTALAIAGYFVPSIVKLIKPRIMAKKQAKQDEANAKAEPKEQGNADADDASNNN